MNYNAHTIYPRIISKTIFANCNHSWISLDSTQRLPLTLDPPEPLRALATCTLKLPVHELLVTKPF